jgi:hypothetical protein
VSSPELETVAALHAGRDSEPMTLEPSLNLASRPDALRAQISRRQPDPGMAPPPVIQVG